MDDLQGIWPPYGLNPIGQIAFSNDRMLASLCNGDATVLHKRDYMSYGGVYQFDGKVLDCLVDIASDAHRIGGHEIRQVERVGKQIMLRPPARMYGDVMQQRELLWTKVWAP